MESQMENFQQPNEEDEQTQQPNEEDIIKRNEFEKNMLLYLKKSFNDDENKPIEKRGMTKLQRDYVIDVLKNTRNKTHDIIRTVLSFYLR